MQATHYSRGPMAALRARLRDARAGHTARRRLRRDLAFAAPREVAELEAILERYPEDQTADIRHVLHERRLAHELTAQARVPGRGLC